MSYFPVRFGLFEGVIKDIVNNKKEGTVVFHSSKKQLGIPEDSNPPSSILYPDSSQYWVSEDAISSGQWFTIQLTDRWISITHFAFYGTGQYPLSFDIEGRVGNEWVLLYSQINSHILQKGPQIFNSLKKVVTNQFRFVNRGPSIGSSQQYRFRISAVDFYGSVTMCNGQCSSPPPYKYIPNLVQTCTKNQQINYFIYITIFIISL